MPALDFPEAFELAWNWARQADWRGIDPYDALTSPLVMRSRRLLGRPFAIAATQALRRLPFDLRPPLGIRPALNPKAMALFLASAVRLRRTEDCVLFAERIAALRTPGTERCCWGYPFPWQARAFYLPAWTPTVVVTSFVGEALLDLHRATGDDRHLEAALSACDFLLNEPNRTEDESGCCLSYSPLDRTAVYNASLLGARLLVLAAERSGNAELLERARPLVTYALARQRQDGSWAYGEAEHHRWSDSFHTGFVLAALDVYQRATGDASTAQAIDTGAACYAERFFGPDGTPYYYSHRRYPLDTHSAAQAVLTFLQLSQRTPAFREKAITVGGWMIDHLLSSSGSFRYQVRRTHTVRIPYMRWSQAWAVRALAELVSSGARR